MPNQLPPIPTPPAQLWREFRISMLPLIVFAGSIVLVMMLWKQYVVPVTVLGLVQTNTTPVITTLAGELTNLNVRQYDLVTNGQVLGAVMVYDPALTAAEVSRAETETQLFGGRMDIAIDGRRQTIAQLEVNLLNTKALLNQDKVNLLLAESNYVRQSELRLSNIIAQSALEIAQTTRDGLRGQVQDRLKLIATTEQWLGTLRPSIEASSVSMSNVIREDILRAQEVVRQTQKPIILVAPVSGRVNYAPYRSGSRVAAGTMIVSITPTNADRVTAFVRQPIIHYPKVGDPVRVRTRSPSRTSGEGKVIQVGSQLEQIGLIFTPWAASKSAVDFGLPITVSLPPGMELLPGELVDVSMHR